MSFFAQIVDPVQTEPSPDELAERIANEVKNVGLHGVSELINSLNTAMQLIWKNQVPNVTAEMIVEKLGTDAAELFAQHAATLTFLTEQIPVLAPKLVTLEKIAPWAKVDFEVVANHPTGRVIVTKK